MKIIAWNCRGLGKGPAIRGLLALQKREDPDILFLSETRMREKGMDKFRWRLNMPHMIVKDCDGKSGGLAMFWKREIKLELRWKGRMHIDATVTEGDGFKWRITGIYGESHADKKVETWHLLRTLHHQEKLPWVCVGDFNEVMYSHEKQGEVSRSQALMDNFREALYSCDLRDLGFEGDIFTWRNNNFHVEGYIRERIDRAVASPAWCGRFPGYKVINGDPEHSDHRPVIVHVDGVVRREKRNSNDPIKKFEAR